MDHECIYFYKDCDDKIPILTASTNDLSLVIPIDKQLKIKLQKEYPNSIDNLFISIDGNNYKLD